MQIKIQLSDGTTKYTSNVSKRQFTSILTNLRAQNANYSGVCTITYAPGYKNEFTFNDLTELTYKGMPCVDKELLDEFREG